MSLGLIGIKIGMTRIFSKTGKSIAVTVLNVPTNRIVQIKKNNIDGYSAIQVTFGYKKKYKIIKPLLGHYLKHKTQIGIILKEFKLKESYLLEKKFKIGDNININIFNIGDKIDVQGITIGKGYAGTIKRHHFSSGRASHGNSKAHKVPGSIGMCQDPGRVFPGKRMSGHLGNKIKTIQNLEILRVDTIKNLLLISGSIPGNKNSNVFIFPSVKFSVKI